MSNIFEVSGDLGVLPERCQVEAPLSSIDPVPGPGSVPWIESGLPLNDPVNFVLMDDSKGRIPVHNSGAILSGHPPRMLCTAVMNLGARDWS